MPKSDVGVPRHDAVVPNNPEKHQRKPCSFLPAITAAMAHPHFHLWADLLVVLGAGILVLLLHFQGWRSREMMNTDMIPYYQGAADFINTGRLPDRGNVSSYESYNPPGASDFLVPGVILFRDGRLQSLIGDAFLFLTTVLFTYLSAREIGGRWVGLAAALFVAVSRTGFQTLVPIGHPAFIVSMLFFLIQWIKARSAPMLGVALAIGALGAYHYLTIAPFFLAIPVLWLIFRPPVGWRSLLAAILIGLAIWFPYLRLEAGRDFLDLQSLILRRSVSQIADGGHRDPIYCYASLSGEPEMRDDTYLPYIGGTDIERRVIYPLEGWKNQAEYASCRVLLNIDRNFDSGLLLLGSNRVLNTTVWMVFLVGWSALGWVVIRTWKPAGKIIDSIRRREWILPIAAAVVGVLIYIVMSPDLVAGIAADQSLERNASLAVEQLRSFLPWIWTAVFLGLFFSFRSSEGTPEKTIFLLAFSVPWFLLMLLAEPGRPERFWFMWPLQMIMVALCLQWVSRRLPRARLAFSILALATGIALLPIRLYADRAIAAWTQGYSGSDSDQWNVIAFLSRQAGVDADGTIKIKYWPPVSQVPGNADYQVYRFEDWFTYLLESRTGVDVLDSGSTVDPTGGSWIIMNGRLETPDAVVGIEPAAVFGNYRIYRLP